MGKKDKPSARSAAYVLVCGLGSLGQQAVIALKRFGVTVVAIEQHPLTHVEIPDLPDLLETLIQGDCAYEPTLRSLDWGACRAAILATSTDQINIETALLIRRYNPQTRLVVRSTQENLNELLAEQLGNFIAYDPLELPAYAYALAALGRETLGFFKLDNHWLQVTTHTLMPDHSWLNQRNLQELNTKNRRLIAHRSPGTPWSSQFQFWDMGQSPQPQDEIIVVEWVDAWSRGPQRLTPTPVKPPTPAGKTWLYDLWHRPPQIYQQVRDWFGDRPLVVLSAWVIAGLLALGTVLLHSSLPDTSFLSAFYSSAVLLLGGYGDLFETLEQAKRNQWVIQPLSLLLTLAGTAFVGVLYALLTENLLAKQFSLLPRRLKLPRENQVILVGMGRVGRRVAQILQEWRQPLVGITFAAPPHRTSPFPLIAEPLPQCLATAQLGTAKSVLVLTDQDLLNLEVALLTQKLNPTADLVIRTNKAGLSQRLPELLPQARLFDMYRLAAEVFVGAAFGENILYLFTFGQTTVLVTEYTIESHDTLVGLLIGDVAYGYGVVPILYQAALHPTPQYFPSDDIILRVGDRLVVLATIEGLKRIEIQDRLAKTWQVVIETVGHADSAFEGANILSRISGCSLKQARQAMAQLPHTLAEPLYYPQALRLCRALHRLQIDTRLVAVPEGCGTMLERGKGD